METIYRYNLQVKTRQVVSMPKGAKILDVQVKESESSHQVSIAVWAIVDTSKEKEDRVFFMYGTGEEAPSVGDMKYISTMQIGAVVVHVFEDEYIELDI